MPINRACRCGALVPLGERCQRCTTARYIHEDRNRGTSTSRGYDADWRSIRALAFARDQWRCVDCGWEPDSVRLWQRAGLVGCPPEQDILEELRRRKNANKRHLHGDHIQRIEDRPELRLVLSNIATRCSVCHDRRTAREHAFGRAIAHG